jgi:phosphoribosyl-ATP pyrophosphohydrolase
MTNPLERLYGELLVNGSNAERHPRTAKLLAAGRSRIAQKLGEEALEVALEVVKGNRDEVVLESADLVYHLVVVWASMGISPSEIWEEMARREQLTGLAGKLPKQTEDIF